MPKKSFMPTFLTAYWKHLVMLNYEVQPEVLLPWLPPGLDLDSWQGKTLASIVAFRFENTRILGLAIPWHKNFEEVNLRFYVRRKLGGVWRKGVVFVKELVPRQAIAKVARWLYGERYIALPMDSLIKHRDSPESQEQVMLLNYWWYIQDTKEGIYAEAKGDPKLVAPNSEAAFITDHSYGYSMHRGTTLEYRVEHPPWKIWEAHGVQLNCDVARLYGDSFATNLKEPCSAFIVDGSPVVVRWGKRISTS